MARCVVTGGAGFIGSHLVDALIADKHEVTIVDNLSSGLRQYVHSQAEFIQQDIQDNLDHVFKGVDYVFHLAAQTNLRHSLDSPQADAASNVAGTVNVLQAAVKQGVKKVIFSSTGGALYAPSAVLPCTEESLIVPQSPYGVAKWCAEQYIRLFHDLYGLKFTILRYSNVFGPRQGVSGEAGVIALFAKKAVVSEPVTIFGDGLQTRDFVFVGDVVAANRLALTLEGKFNVATGVETSVLDVVKMLEKNIGKEIQVNHAPAINGELRRSCLSAQRLQSHGWSPKVSLQAGMQQIVDFFKK